MKILVFSPYYPPHIGGVENYVKEFCHEMMRRGHTLSIFTPNLPPTYPSETETESLSIIRFPAFEIVPNYPIPCFWKWQFWKQLWKLARSKPDMVMSQTRFFFTSLLALLYAKMQSLPHIHIEHGSGFVNVSNRVTTAASFFYDHTFGRIILRFADQNVCISHAVSRFVARFDRRPACIIYRGMDFDTLAAAAPAADLRKRFSGKTILASAARLSRWKGIENVIRAIERLSPAERAKIVYLIIGDGEDRNRLERLVSRGTPVFFLGSLPRERVFSILKTIDLYIHSAHRGGGLSTSLLEALYAGCAVIASPNEGADEVIEHRRNGLLLEASSAENIARGIQILLQDPQLLSEIRKNSQGSVKTRFSWTAAGDQFDSLYKHLAHQ